MISRIWHGRTNLQNAGEYLRYLLEDGTKDIIHTPGNISVKVWKQEDSDFCHFWTISEWQDINSIKSFAGEDYEKAQYYPQDHGKLLTFEEKADHYECYDASASGVNDLIRQIEQLYQGGSWQGESFEEKLKDIDENTAYRQPFPGVHSVAEIVWHCIYWHRVLMERLKGNLSYSKETAEELNFLPVEKLKEMGWENLRKQLMESTDELLLILKEHRDNYLQNEISPGVTAGYMFEGVLHHDIYHLGQIGLIKKLNGLNLEVQEVPLKTNSFVSYFNSLARF